MPRLFCFCLIISQLLGRGAARTGSPLYGCTKPGRPGCGGAAQGWARPGNWQPGQHALKLVPHGAEPWEPAGWASQGGQAMVQLPGQLPVTQGCSSTCGLIQEVRGTPRKGRMESDPAPLTRSPGLSPFRREPWHRHHPGAMSRSFPSAWPMCSPSRGLVNLLLASSLQEGTLLQTQQFTNTGFSTWAQCGGSQT